MHKKIDIEPISIQAYPSEPAQLDALKAFMKAMKIKFSVKKDKPYNKAFVAKILQGDEDFKNGKFKAIKTKDLWK